MANEYRNVRDYFFGTLSSAAAVSDTTLASAAFAQLGTISATYLPLILHDPSTGVHEKVWMTAHTASATTATVVRGKEGTSATSWAAGTQILCAPTVRDGLSVLPLADLPADPHVGQRVSISNQGLVVERTYTGGWQASVGVAVPGDFGLRLDGTAIPTTSTLVMRGGRVAGTTAASGRLTGTYAVPFPNQTLRVVPIWVSGGSGNLVLAIEPAVPATASQFTLYAYAPGTGATAGSGISVTFDYIAIGY